MRSIFLTLLFTGILSGIFAQGSPEFWRRKVDGVPAAQHLIDELPKAVPAILESSEFKTGLGQLNDKQYEEALATFSAYHKKQPDNLIGQYLVGIAEFFNQKYTESNHTLTTAIGKGLSMDEKHLVHNFRGLARYMADDFKRASVDFDVVRLLNEVDPLASFWFGESSGMAQDYEDAIEGLEEAIKYGYYDLAHSYTRLGEFYFLKREYDQAWKALEKAEVLAPGSAEIFFYEGEIYKNQDKLELAMEAYDKAMERATEWELTLILGKAAEVASWMGKSAQAEGYYNHLLRDDPENATMLFQRGNSLLKLRKFSKAVDDFANAAKFGHPNQELCFYKMGYAASRSGNFPVAVLAFDKAIELNVKEGEYWHERSIAKLSSGDFPGAETDAKEAIELGISGQIVFAKLTRAIAVVRQDRFREAIYILDEILKDDPKFVPAYTFRAEAKAGINNLSAAHADLDKALAIDPDNRKALELKETLGK